MKPTKIVILGGTGFVGRHLLARLATDFPDAQCLVPTRHPARHRDVLVLPKVELEAADIHDPAVLERLFQGATSVINLVGILNERGDNGQGFQHAHSALAEKIAAAAKKTGVTRILQMSALNAHPDAPSFYLQSKGLAEKILQEANLALTIFRPSVIFGPEDGFMNLFAKLLRLVPLFLPLGSADSRFAPVYVGDVAAVMAKALADDKSIGQVFSLCGPKTYTLKQLVQYVDALQGGKHFIIGLNKPLSYVQAFVFDKLPGKLLSLDNLRSLQLPSVCPEGSPTQPTSLEAIVPTYIGMRQPPLDHFRQQAGREN